MAGSREWATASRFQCLCVSVFDQASPGPQEHSFNTSCKRTKRLLSAVPHPHPASTHWHPGANSGGAQPLLRTLKRTGRSIKHTGDTLAVDKHQHNRLQHWLPQRWESTEYTASSDKGREGSSWATDSWKASANWPSKTQHCVYFVSQMQYTQGIHSGACKQQSSTGSVCKSNINL